MDYLVKFIENFNSLTYSSQCNYVKNKLLSFDLYEIQFIMFFKKLHVLLNDLPSHFKKIGKDAYFCVTRGFIRIEYKKISNNIYSVKILIQNSKLYLHTYIEIK